MEREKTSQEHFEAAVERLLKREGRWSDDGLGELLRYCQEELSEMYRVRIVDLMAGDLVAEMMSDDELEKEDYLTLYESRKAAVLKAGRPGVDFDDD